MLGMMATCWCCTGMTMMFKSIVSRRALILMLLPIIQGAQSYDYRRTAFLLPTHGQTTVIHPYNRPKTLSSSDSSFALSDQLAFPERAAAPFQWKPPEDTGVNPAKEGFSCFKLLSEDAFFDKSAALYQLLKTYFDSRFMDFQPARLHIMCPRQFGKTTLLEFIEAVYSPMPQLDGFDAGLIKSKIAGLERGKELLKFGQHPVLRLDFKDIKSVTELNDHIGLQLKLAGLDYSSIKDVMSPERKLSLNVRIIAAVKILNEKFEAILAGTRTKTIVLIDNFDIPFVREVCNSWEDSFLSELDQLQLLGHDSDRSISLLVLCSRMKPLTWGLLAGRIEGQQVFVSDNSVYHGLCGISARELVMCSNGQLDNVSRKQYQGQTFKEVVEQRFAPAWSGFRFGFKKGAGELDPDSQDGALFSPLDAWELVQSLRKDDGHMPSSQWQATMGGELEFATFSDRYTSSLQDMFELYRTLHGGLVNWYSSVSASLRRTEYLNIEKDLDVMKVLFEQGLLTVKEIDDDHIRLGSPNWMVKKNALKLMMMKTGQGATPEHLAKEYLSNAGFEDIVLRAALEVNNVDRDVANPRFQKHPFQEFLMMELLARFPDNDKHYKFYEEAPVLMMADEQKEKDGEDFTMALTLHYDNSPKMAYIIVLKVAAISKSDADSINAAHERNIKEVTDRFQSCIWQGPAVETEQGVVVSAVWPPRRDSAGGGNIMRHKCKFLTTPTNAP